MVQYNQATLSSIPLASFFHETFHDALVRQYFYEKAQFCMKNLLPFHATVPDALVDGTPTSLHS